jgi:hypothetical protein
MALPKAHHIETLSEFNSLKFSYDSTNTHYFTGGTDTIVEGTPDILYTDIAYIKPLSCIYTHAKIYPCPVLEYDNVPTANSSNLVNSGNIKKAIDSAIGGVPNALKQVDLTTYQGTTNGEIVQHTGATTANYVNGWNYKLSDGGTIPAHTLHIKQMVGGERYDTTSDEIAAHIATYKFPFVYKGKKVLYESYNNGFQVYFPEGYPKVGDPCVMQTGAINYVTAVTEEEVIVDDWLSFPTTFRESAWFENGDGVQIYTTFNVEFPVSGDLVSRQAYFELGTTWGCYNVDFTFSKNDEAVSLKEWKQHDSQPSSTADVSDLKTRMTAAETAIQGKQATITGAASTITTANLTASKVLGSDANGKVAATSIATADAEDAVSKRHTQNTDTKIISGGNKVEVTSGGISIVGYTLFSAGGEKLRVSSNGVASLANTSVTGNLSVSGNLNVTGKETVTEIVHVESENNTITLRKGAQTAVASGSLSGTRVENYDGLDNNLVFGTDASGVFRIGDEGGTLEPIATRDEAANLTDGQAMTWNATNQRLIGKTIDSTPTSASTNLITSGGVKTAIDTAPRFYLGTCSTAGNVAIKQVDIPNFPTQLVNGVETPIVGSVIAVKFASYDNATSEQKKIKVNNTSAYPVWYADSEITQTYANGYVFGQTNKYIYYVFNGTHWVWVSISQEFDTHYSPQTLGFGYASCTTAAATAAKTASLSNYNLINGGLVVVYFQYDVPAQATLNINNQGAKEIHFGSSRIAAGVIKAGDKCLFIYNGNYMLIAIDRWGKELQEKVSGINISETDFEALSTYEQGKLYFVYDNNS